MPLAIRKIAQDIFDYCLLTALWLVFFCERNMSRLIAFVLVLGSVGYLAIWPDQYTPLVQLLVAIFLSLAGYWIGSNENALIAAKHANDRWVPQAESVIFRLMTLRSNVARLAIESQKQCDESVCELPELGQETLRPISVKLKADCRASTQRLADISRQLDDVIGDWRRFVVANCQGAECGRIEEAVASRAHELAKELDFEKTCRATSLQPGTTTTIRNGRPLGPTESHEQNPLP